MIMTGKVWKYGDDVNTDVIFPGRYTYTLINENEMGRHALEDLDPVFSRKCAKGDIIVAGKNWGCGSAREQAVKCLKAKGIGAIIAKGFARIYYRNCLNEGLITIVCPKAVDSIEDGEEVSIDFDNSVIKTRKGDFPFSPYPKFVRELVENGGLLPYIKKSLRDQGKLE
jgi:3-isopropylmalate/(R)-2-methylmalate dehydratase small subunit